MPLKLRPTGLGSGIDKDRPDYTVVTGEWEVGRIYETRGGPDNLRWFWSMTVNGPMTRSDRVATLEEAKAQFQKSWDAWKAWAMHGRGAIDLRCRSRRRPRRSGKKNPAAGGAGAGLSTGGSPRRARSWTSNRASRPR
jgi:hypothetical protein